MSCGTCLDGKTDLLVCSQSTGLSPGLCLPGHLKRSCGLSSESSQEVPGLWRRWTEQASGLAVHLAPAALLGEPLGIDAGGTTVRASSGEQKAVIFWSLQLCDCPGDLGRRAGWGGSWGSGLAAEAKELADSKQGLSGTDPTYTHREQVPGPKHQMAQLGGEQNMRGPPPFARASDSQGSHPSPSRCGGSAQRCGVGGTSDFWVTQCPRSSVGSSNPGGLVVGSCFLLSVLIQEVP